MLHIKNDQEGSPLGANQLLTGHWRGHRFHSCPSWWDSGDLGWWRWWCRQQRSTEGSFRREAGCRVVLCICSCSKLGLIEPRWEQTVPRRVWRESWPPLCLQLRVSETCGKTMKNQELTQTWILRFFHRLLQNATKYQSCLLFLSRFHRRWLDFNILIISLWKLPFALKCRVVDIHSTEWHSFYAQFIYQWLQKETWIRQWNEWECALLVQTCVSWVNDQSRSMVDELPSLTKIAGITPRQDRQIGRFLQLLQ